MDKQQEFDIMAVILDVGLTLDNSAVFQSQVVDQMIALSQMGYRVGVIAVESDPVVFERAIRCRFQQSDITTYSIPDRGFARNLLSMVLAIRRIKKFRCAYVRGLWGPVVLVLGGLSRSIRYIYDVRGSVADEAKARGTGGVKLAIYLALEAWGIRRATKVTAVTNALAKSLRESHVLKSVTVIPCCVDIRKTPTSREVVMQRRKELGYSESDIVMLYSGGLSHYQQVPAMMSLWERLRDVPDLHFLLLTNDDPVSKLKVVGGLEIFKDRLKRMSLPRGEVLATLAAADIGCMLRDSRELNRVASPVKFAEYLSAGLAIIASPGTGDASGQIEEHHLGALVDPLRLEEGEVAVRELLKRLREDRSALRERAYELARRHYDWNSHRESYLGLYGQPSFVVAP